MNNPFQTPPAAVKQKVSPLRISRHIPGLPHIAVPPLQLSPSWNADNAPDAVNADDQNGVHGIEEI